MTLSVDVGGTFTDLVWWDGAELRVGKTSSTPDQSEGVVDGARALLKNGVVQRFVHGTTVATNALLERAGAATVLITSHGFGDVLEIARQDRPSLYDAADLRATPLVGRGTRLEVGARGAPEPAELAELTERVVDAGAIAISLLYGYERPDDEAAVADAVRARLPDAEISVSSHVAPEFREYERTSTTVVNAYLGPVTAGYLRRLVDRSEAAGLPSDIQVMRSSGGLIPIESAAALPASILLSGPAGGVVASAALGSMLGHRRMISFDMGGTSTDVCRIEDGQPEVAYERSIEGYAVRMPSVAIHTVGAGGGSLGWLDPGGALRVGPRSAGAFPGPASYGRGGSEPAVTDANLALGRLGAATRLAGSLQLDGAAALAALARLGARAGLDAETTARGMVEIVEAHMERAIRRVSVEEGADPRPAVLVAFGGAGGLHASALARRLEMSGVVIPRFAGVFSAVGLLLSPPRVDLAQSILVTAPDEPVLHRELGELARRATELFEVETGEAPERVSLVADARYVGQSHETPIPVDPGLPWPALAERFHAAHHQRNGFSRPGDPVEVVTIRAAAEGRPALRMDQLPDIRPDGPARIGERPVWTGGGWADAAVWRRYGLAPGDEVVGPAIIEETEATTYLADGERATVHPSGALEVSW